MCRAGAGDVGPALFAVDKGYQANAACGTGVSAGTCPPPRRADAAWCRHVDGGGPLHTCAAQNPLRLRSGKDTLVLGPALAVRDLSAYPAPAPGATRPLRAARVNAVAADDEHVYAATTGLPGSPGAVLRLRVPVAAAARDQINPAFLLAPSRLDRLTRLVETWWPEAIAPSDIADPALWEAAAAAHAALETFLADPTV